MQEEAARLGLAVPDPKAITYLSANDGNAARLAHLLGTDSFLLAPSVPSSYPSQRSLLLGAGGGPDDSNRHDDHAAGLHNRDDADDHGSDLERFEQRQLSAQQQLGHLGWLDRRRRPLRGS